SGARATVRDPCRALLMAALVALPLLLAVRPVGAELRPGTVLGPDNWEEAKGLLPDEFLEAYRRGDLRHEIRNWDPIRLQEDDPVFAAALKENEGRYDLDDANAIIDRQTGKPADAILAWPFPKIDPSDPKAGAKIVWNYFYTLYYGGSGQYRGDLRWISRGGLDRSIGVGGFQKRVGGEQPRFCVDDGREE